MRMGDKIKRLQNNDKNKITMLDDEQMRDTLHNYSAIMIMLLDEK